MAVLFVLVSLAGLVWWIAERARIYRERIAACPGHEINYVSVFNEGRMWVAMCRHCPYQDPVRDLDLTERLTREFRLKERT